MLLSSFASEVSSSAAILCDGDYCASSSRIPMKSLLIEPEQKHNMSCPKTKTTLNYWKTADSWTLSEYNKYSQLFSYTKLRAATRYTSPIIIISLLHFIRWIHCPIILQWYEAKKTSTAAAKHSYLAFDKDRSGTIDIWELRQVLAAMGLGWLLTWRSWSIRLIWMARARLSSMSFRSCWENKVCRNNGTNAQIWCLWYGVLIHAFCF